MEKYSVSLALVMVAKSLLELVRHYLLHFTDDMLRALFLRGFEVNDRGLNFADTFIDAIKTVIDSLFQFQSFMFFVRFCNCFGILVKKGRLSQISLFPKFDGLHIR